MLPSVLADPVDRFLLERIAAQERAVGMTAAAEFGLSRQATATWLRRLAQSGFIIASGTGRGVKRTWFIEPYRDGVNNDRGWPIAHRDGE